MGDELTIHDLLDAVAKRAEKTGRASSTRVEIATHLGRSRIEVDPIFDQAVEKGLLVEGSRYKDFWQLSEAGEIARAERLYS